jgi:hypothetical protein
MTSNSDPSELQGEGDYDAARRYNDATKRFVDSGAVPQAAHDAAPQTPEQAQELEAAELEAAKHAKGEDPQVHRPDNLLARANARKKAPPIEDEGADPVGDGHSDADFAAQLSPPANSSPAPRKAIP